MPRNRSVRVATVGSTRQRQAAGSSSYGPRSASPGRRRLVVVGLVLVSLALLTVYFRESDGGALHRAQSTGASVLHPFQVAGERVARPFRDAYGWFSGLVDAKDERERLKEENDRLRREAILGRSAIRENGELRRLLGYRNTPNLEAYDKVTARVISRPSGSFVQQIVVAAGSRDGVTFQSPVVTPDGLVGLVTKVARSQSVVTLLTDDSMAAAGLDLETGASGIVRHGQSPGSSLIIDRVPKEAKVATGDIVVTAGWCSSRLVSLFPRNIPVGEVTSVGQVETDIFKHVEIQPKVDFGSLEVVMIAIPKPGERPPTCPKAK